MQQEIKKSTSNSPSTYSSSRKVEQDCTTEVHRSITAHRIDLGMRDSPRAEKDTTLFNCIASPKAAEVEQTKTKSKSKRSMFADPLTVAESYEKPKSYSSSSSEEDDGEESKIPTLEETESANSISNPKPFNTKPSEETLLKMAEEARGGDHLARAESMAKILEKLEPHTAKCIDEFVKTPPGQRNQKFFSESPRPSRSSRTKTFDVDSIPTLGEVIEPEHKTKSYNSQNSWAKKIPRCPVCKVEFGSNNPFGSKCVKHKLDNCGHEFCENCLLDAWIRMDGESLPVEERKRLEKF